MKHNQAPTLGFTMIVLALLLGPWSLKLILREEPYPAIILPSGAGRVDLQQGQVRTTKLVCEGIRPDGTRLELPIDELLAPAPSYFKHKIYSNEFGLSLEQRERIRSRFGLVDTSFKRKALTEENLAQTRDWFLEKVGHEFSSLRMIKLEVVLDVSNGDRLSSEILEEKTYALR